MFSFVTSGESKHIHYWLVHIYYYYHYILAYSFAFSMSTIAFVIYCSIIIILKSNHLKQSTLSHIFLWVRNPGAAQLILQTHGVCKQGYHLGLLSSYASIREGSGSKLIHVVVDTTQFCWVIGPNVCVLCCLLHEVWTLFFAM